MKTFPLVSIVTINYNQAETTNQMLRSLDKISYPDFQTIVVDNHSDPQDISRIRINPKNTRLICNLQNLGFSGGNNTGINAAEGSYILLLNNDTEVAPDFLEPMVELMEKKRDVAAVSPKIKYFSAPDTIQYAGFTLMNSVTLRMKSIGHKQRDDAAFNKISETPYAHGCAMLIRKKVIDEIGPMPESYFLYYEEHDYSLTIRRNGYKIYYQPESLVYHKESISVQKGSTLKTYYINRNRILFMRRNFSLPNKILASCYLLLVSIPKNILYYLAKREVNHLKAYLNALNWNLNQKNI